MSAVVDGTALTLTYEGPKLVGAADHPSGLTKEEFTVEVDGTEVEVTGISEGTTTKVGSGATAKRRKPYTLTLAESVWGGQTATVSYAPADTGLHTAPIVTGHAVTVSTANRPPTITFTAPTGTTPPGDLVNFPFTVADPDIDDADLEIIVPGETPTDAANALTLSISAEPADVIDRLYYAGGAVYVKVKRFDELCGLTPQPPATFNVEVTATATDSDGASQEATITMGSSEWGPADCRPALAAESPATVDGQTLTLTFAEALDEDSAPAATDFAVTVAGAARHVSDVTVTGSTVELTLAPAVTKGQTVTVSYTADATRPIQRAGLTFPAESFTDQAVENATGQTPVLEGAVVVGAALTLFYDEALDESSEPATGDFAVTVAGSARSVSTVAVTGARVELTLASAVEEGEAVTVSYTKGTDPIRDTHANHYEAADFSGETVDNRTGDTTGPQLQSSIVVLGAEITLTYDELLHPAYTPVVTHFIVNDNSPGGGRLTVSSVKILGRTAVLTLAAPVTEAQVATMNVTYNHDAATAIRDLAGNFGPVISTDRNRPPGVRLTYGAPRPTPRPHTPLPPVASAGADVEADPGAEVTLDGSASSDPDGNALTYAWTRVSGAAVALSGEDAAQAAFTAPVEPGEIVFRLTVTDPGGLTGSDDVTVTVRDVAPGFGDVSVPALELGPGEAMEAVVLPEARGGNGALSYRLSSAPAGLAGLEFDAVTRTLWGTAAVEGGSYTFTYRADDGDANRAATDAAMLTFVVTVGDEAPSFGDASVPALELGPGEAMEAVVLPEARGGNGALSYRLSSAPAGLAGLEFDAATRTLWGTAAVEGGSYTFTYRADDGDANRAATDAAMLTFAVTVPDLAPSFGDASVPALELAPGEAMEAVVLPEARGGNGALSYRLSSVPAGLAGLEFDAATRTLSGTPETTGSWVFTYRADDGDANRAATDAAILTFAVTVGASAELVKQTVTRTLAAVAHRAVTSALDNIGARFATPVPASGLTLAGETVPLGVSGTGIAGAERACAAGASGAAREGCAPVTWSRTIEPAELVRTSAFSLALGAAKGSVAGAPAPLLWSAWGRGDLGAFAGRTEPGTRYEGELRTGWLGVDVRAVRWVAGLAVSHGTGEADYEFDTGAGSEQGRLETWLTALYPYGRWTPLDGLEVRGVLGAGRGEAGHRFEDGPRETSVLSMGMASAGVRHELPALAGIDLAVRADGSLARLETEDGPEFVDGLTADNWRVRAGLEASRRFALDRDTALELFVEAAARQDGGDGLAGTGVEVAGGLHFTAPWLHLEARGRLLAAHTEDGAEERGVSVTARVGPGSHGRGLSLMLSPRIGAGTAGANALWGDELPAAAAVSGRTAAAVDARIGYGVGLASHGLLTPFAETGLAGADGRRLRLGTRFEASHLNIELAGEHRESGAAEPEQVLRLDLTLGY